METIDRLAITQGQKIVQTTVEFSGKEKIETMDRLAIIQGQKLFKTTVGFSSSRSH